MKTVKILINKIQQDPKTIKIASNYYLLYVAVILCILIFIVFIMATIIYKKTITEMIFLVYVFIFEFTLCWLIYMLFKKCYFLVNDELDFFVYRHGFKTDVIYYQDILMIIPVYLGHESILTKKCVKIDYNHWLYSEYLAKLYEILYKKYKLEHADFNLTS